MIIRENFFIVLDLPPHMNYEILFSYMIPNAFAVVFFIRKYNDTY